MLLGSGGISDDCFITNLLLNLVVEEFWKSVKVGKVMDNSIPVYTQISKYTVTKKL